MIRRRVCGQRHQVLLLALPLEDPLFGQPAEDRLRVVAGPWLGDELGELLYWIPFLRCLHSCLRLRFG